MNKNSKIYKFLKRVKIKLIKLKNKIKYINLSFSSYNNIALNIMNQQRTYKKVKKLLKNYKFPQNDYANFETSNYIWIYWNSGIETAPILIRKCFESLKNNFPDKNIIALSDDNLKDYIVLPDYIINKYKKGKIGRAHFSDIIRISLLEKYGGCWLDSTVYCTSNDLPDFIFNSKLFVYKKMNLDRSDKDYLVASSWLISSCKDNNIIVSVRDLLYKYWRKHNKLLDYYLFHIIFQLVTEHYIDEFEEVPFYPNSVPHLLMFNLLKPYTVEQWNLIKKLSPFHKLNRVMESEDTNSFYQKLIRDELK